MKYLVAAVVLVCLFGVFARADSRQTQAPLVTPYEICLPADPGGLVIRVSKYDGRTWFIGGNGFRGNLKQMAWNPIPLAAGVTGQRGEAVEYQVYQNTGGGVLLLNVATGASWYLDAENKQVTWHPVEELK